jgi:hypothetical protein
VKQRRKRIERQVGFASGGRHDQQFRLIAPLGRRARDTVVRQVVGVGRGVGQINSDRCFSNSR